MAAITIRTRGFRVLANGHCMNALAIQARLTDRHGKRRLLGSKPRRIAGLRREILARGLVAQQPSNEATVARRA